MNPRKSLALIVALGLLMMALLVPAHSTYAKEMTGAMSPAWSPDGRQIAYVIYKDQQPDLYLVDVNGSTPTEIAENGSEPAWSPDGSRIAFTSYANDNTRVNILDLANGQQTQLTLGYSPRWSPDGKRLAYLAGQELFIANSDGSTPRTMITGPSMILWDYSWSPDSKQLALTVQANINGATDYYLINPDGTQLHKIGSATNNTGISWSPDGRQLIFIGDCGNSDSMCVVNADGTNLHTLTKYRGAFQPTWSPDGKQILFTNSGICLVNADGTQRRSLTGQDITTSDSQGLWSPDGSHIAFVRMHYPTAGNSESYFVYFEVDIMNADGSNLHRLPDGLTDL